MRLTMFAMISPKTIRHVGSPATFAASTKSRFRSESACPRRILASTAQVVSPMIRTSIVGPRFGMNAAITTSSGSVGMTRKTFVTRFTTSSIQPPL